MTDGPRERLVGATGAILAAAALAVAAGPTGALVGALVALAWYRLPAAYAFALGQVLAAPLIGDAGLAALLATEAGLLAVLAAPLLADARTLGAFVAGTAGLLAVVWAAFRAWEPLWAAAFALAVVAALAAYALHRVERVRLGLVEGAA